MTRTAISLTEFLIIVSIIFIGAGLLASAVVKSGHVEHDRRVAKEIAERGAAYLAEHGIAPVGKASAEAPAPVQVIAPAATVVALPVGITLRQWYAGQALSALGTGMNVERRVKEAWAVADEMLVQEHLP